MSTWYAKERVSTCEIAGAVAAAAIHDLTVNSFTFGAFPQILVVEPADQAFTIHLSLQVTDRQAMASFELTRQEAFTAARLFRKSKGTKHDAAIFKRVQTAVADLEGQMARRS